MADGASAELSHFCTITGLKQQNAEGLECAWTSFGERGLDPCS